MRQLGLVMIGVLVGVVIGGGSVALALRDTSPAVGGAVAAASDVGIDRCEIGRTDGRASSAEARGTVTNPTGGMVDYQIELSFTDEAGATLGTERTFIENVSPGVPTDWSVSGVRDLKAINLAQCQLVAVERTPAS